ncbi:MAG: hypothetical protein Aurels2KO_05760 [Aureliella sp.]
MLGSVDLEVGGGDLDLDVDLNAGGNPIATGMSAFALRWMNIRDVPLIVWLGVFSISWWFVSASLWSLIDSTFFTPPGWLWSTVLAIKNAAIAILLTKLATTPMKPWFVTERLVATSLIGKECEISSLTATPDFGQVRYKTEGAPLLLNVRTDGPTLSKGDRVWLAHYDEKTRTYIVSPTFSGAVPTTTEE